MNANIPKELTLAMLLNQATKDMPCLWEPLLPQNGLVCLAGSSDTGKSAFLRQFAMCVCAGKDTFLDMKLNPRYRSVIYCSTEDNETAIAWLANKQNNTLCIPTEHLERFRLLFDCRRELVAELDRRISIAPVDVVIIDCYSDIFSGDINDNNQVRSYMSKYEELCERHDCLVLFLHHCGKRTEDMVPSKHNLVGSQTFEAKMRTVLELRNDCANPHRKYLTCLKGNYVSPEYKNRMMELSFGDDLVFFRIGVVPVSDTKIKRISK